MSRIRAFLDQISPDELIRRLDLAIEGTGLGIWDWDLGDDSVNFDRRWCEMLGLVHAETPMHLGTWEARVHPDDIEQCYADIQAHLDGKTERYENVHRMKHADGRWVWILDRGRISARDDDGKPVRFTGTHTDVTAKEEARLARERHREQLLQLVAHLPVSVALFDASGRLLARSPDWPSSEDAESSDTPFAALPSEGGPTLEHVRRALEGAPTFCDEETVQGAGGPRYVRWSCQAWTGSDGSVAGVQVSYTDVTEEVVRRRREAEEHDARVAALALFAGGVAHELNSPLQAIMTETEGVQLERARGKIADDVLDESLEIIRSTARRAGLITRALRALSRESRDDDPSRVSVAELWRHVTALCGSGATAAGVELRILTVDASVHLLAREAEVLQGLLTLVRNGLDAAREASDAWVMLEAHVLGDRVVLRCSDSGSGVPARHQDDIFEPWFTTKPPGSGTGLGLAIARRLLQRNDGDVRYVPDQANTTFELELPSAVGVEETVR